MIMAQEVQWLSVDWRMSSLIPDPCSQCFEVLLAQSTVIQPQRAVNVAADSFVTFPLADIDARLKNILAYSERKETETERRDTIYDICAGGVNISLQKCDKDLSPKNKGD